MFAWERGLSGVIGLVLTVFLFQTLLENYIFETSYIDEGLAAFFFCFFVLEVITGWEISVRDLLVCVLVLLIMAAGVYGNVRFGIQEHKAAILLDIVSHFKFAAIFLGVRSFVKTHSVDYERAIRVPVFLAKIYLTVLFVFGVLNLFVNLGMYGEIRYGMRAYAFVFGTPGIVTNTVLYIFMLLFMESALCPGKGNTVFLAMAESLMLMVLKSRSFILAAAILMLYETLIIERKKSISTRLVVIGAVGGLIGYPQYQNYFVNGVTANTGQSARQLFWQNGIELFKEHFPFGTGFRDDPLYRAAAVHPVRDLPEREGDRERAYHARRVHVRDQRALLLHPVLLSGQQLDGHADLYRDAYAVLRRACGRS